jgi:hypothetical protein
MAEQATKRASDVVREALKEIGALVDNPPEGWRKQVEEVLEKHKLKMHQVSIYQLRQKEMAKQAGGKPVKKRGRKPGKAKAVAKTVRITPANGTIITINNVKLSVDDLKAVKELAERLGGLDSLSTIVHGVQTLLS